MTRPNLTAKSLTRVACDDGEVLAVVAIWTEVTPLRCGLVVRAVGVEEGNGTAIVVPGMTVVAVVDVVGDVEA